MSIEIKISNRPISYDYAIKFLEIRVNQLKAGKKKDLIWLLEHPTTFTSGVRANDNEILDKKINIIKTNRGGKITLHNPGQKIIYFAIDLNKRKKDIRKLINIIEITIIEFLKLYNISAISDKKNIGIWVNDKKIAAIGLRVSKWIAYHGFSINVNNDLKDFKKILPCGLKNTLVTSIKNERNQNIKNLNSNLLKIFKSNLKKI